jgi:ribonuclease HI
LSQQHSYHAYFGGGRGTNTKEELLALWGILWLARSKSINQLQVLGDSKVIINWVEGKFKLQILELEHWKRRIGLLKQQFGFISFSHIYRHHNSEADSLSKKAVHISTRTLLIEEWINGRISSMESCPLSLS